MEKNILSTIIIFLSKSDLDKVLQNNKHIFAILYYTWVKKLSYVSFSCGSCLSASMNVFVFSSALSIVSASAFNAQRIRHRVSTCAAITRILCETPCRPERLIARSSWIYVKKKWKSQQIANKFRRGHKHWGISIMSRLLAKQDFIKMNAYLLNYKIVKGLTMTQL